MLEVRGPIGGWFVWDGETPALLRGRRVRRRPVHLDAAHRARPRPRRTCCASPSPAAPWPSCPTPTSSSTPGRCSCSPVSRTASARPAGCAPRNCVPLWEPGQTAYVCGSASFAEAASQLLVAHGRAGDVDPDRAVRPVGSRLNQPPAAARSGPATHAATSAGCSEPHDDEVRPCAQDVLHALGGRGVRAPGPAHDVVGIGQHRAQRRLDVAVPEHLAAQPPAERPPGHPPHDHAARKVEPDEAVGPVEEQLAHRLYCHSVTQVGPATSRATSSANSGRGVHAGPWWSASISVCRQPRTSAIAPASVVLPEPLVPATRMRSRPRR